MYQASIFQRRKSEEHQKLQPRRHWSVLSDPLQPRPTASDSNGLHRRMQRAGSLSPLEDQRHFVRTAVPAVSVLLIFGPSFAPAPAPAWPAPAPHLGPKAGFERAGAFPPLDRLTILISHEIFTATALLNKNSPRLSRSDAICPVRAGLDRAHPVRPQRPRHSDCVLEHGPQSNDIHILDPCQPVCNRNFRLRAHRPANGQGSVFINRPCMGARSGGQGRASVFAGRF